MQEQKAETQDVFSNLQQGYLYQVFEDHSEISVKTKHSDEVLHIWTSDKNPAVLSVDVPQLDYCHKKMQAHTKEEQEQGLLHLLLYCPHV